MKGNLIPEGDLIAEIVRRIVDAAQPEKSFSSAARHVVTPGPTVILTCL
jgi:hypothetical protein